MDIDDVTKSMSKMEVEDHYENPEVRELLDIAMRARNLPTSNGIVNNMKKEGITTLESIIYYLVKHILLSINLYQNNYGMIPQNIRTIVKPVFMKYQHIIPNYELDRYTFAFSGKGKRKMSKNKRGKRMKKKSIKRRA